MRRKVIRHGSSTLTISIPLKWARINNVKKGDELVVEEKGNKLNISLDKEQAKLEKKEIDVEEFRRLGTGYMIGLYRDGFDEIELKYKDQDYVEQVQKLIAAELKGFEIIKQSKNSCTIKDLLGISRGDFDVALRRLWVLSLSIADDMLSSIKEGDLVTTKNIIKRDNSINGFANYCVRIISKKGLINERKNCSSYFLVTTIEEIADQYKEISIHFLDNEQKLSKDSIDIFTTINKYLRELYELSYKFNKHKAEELFTGTKQTPKRIKKLLVEKNNDIVTLSYLLNICEQIRSLLDITIELNISKDKK